MRLHMTLSAILAGLPVLNFGYEPKNLGVLKTVGLSEFYSSFDRPDAEMIKTVNEFLSTDLEMLQKKVQQANSNGKRLFDQTFTYLAKQLR